MSAKFFALSILFVSSLLFAGIRSESVTIFNSIPRRDTSGEIMDAHDGKVLGPFPHLGGLYLWYAASYGDCKEPSGNSGCSVVGPGKCGFQFNHNVSLWSSKNLKEWHPHGPVFQAATSGLVDPIMFCPKVLYNNATDTWVMWVNPILGANFGISYYAVATSKTFTGPFKLASRNVTTLAFSDVGDFNLFTDDDGTGYVIYTSHITGSGETHRMSVEQLSPDYTSSLGASGSSGYFGNSFVEAPAFFKRASTYYAVFGQCCCYCESGSPVYVYTSSHPLGPYTMQSGGPIDATLLSPFGSSESDHTASSGRVSVVLNSKKEKSTSEKSAHGSNFYFLPPKGRLATSGISAQQTDITSYIGADGQRHYIWIGDRWQQAPDGIKGHDPTYWGPLAFTSDGAVIPIIFESNFTINIKA